MPLQYKLPGYIGNAVPQYLGIFTYQSRNSLGRIPDGTSNTFMFGEYVGGYLAWGGGGGLADGLAGPSVVCGFGYTGFNGPSPTGSMPHGPNGTSYWYTFGSDHTANIMNVCYGDGSVRTISPTIDFSTWVYLSGMQDGVAVNMP